MPPKPNTLTCSFHEIIAARVRRDPAFRRALRQAAKECRQAGDAATAQAVLRLLTPNSRRRTPSGGQAIPTPPSSGLH
jgi:hypothetical protein